MHKLILGAVVAAFAALSAPVAFAQSMTVTSAEVSDGATIKDAQVANVFGCKGGNISPSLSWNGAPSDAKRASPLPSTIRMRPPVAASGTGSCSTFRLRPRRSR